MIRGVWSTRGSEGPHGDTMRCNAVDERMTNEEWDTLARMRQAVRRRHGAACPRVTAAAKILDRRDAKTSVWRLDFIDGLDSAAFCSFLKAGGNKCHLGEQFSSCWQVKKKKYVCFAALKNNSSHLFVFFYRDAFEVWQHLWKAKCGYLKFKWENPVYHLRGNNKMKCLVEVNRVAVHK